MKQYLFVARAAGKMIRSTVNAASDENAQEGFVKNLNAGKFSIVDEPLYTPRHIFVTYEELDNGTTKVNIGETSAGSQMGRSSVVTG
jgi:hypothetical protein|tara:strand:+ start:942 stop:1202 length:261 start_codon:yes stop_codon:yes gene_type:complete